MWSAARIAALYARGVRGSAAALRPKARAAILAALQIRNRSVLALLCAGLAACGSGAGPESEDYGNILASPGGLVLLEEEHPTGWMRPDCFGCHNVNNMHQVNRTGLPDDEVDLPGVRAIVQSGGEASCPMCHGSNGVLP
jgi:hypothetical protein